MLALVLLLALPPLSSQAQRVQLRDFFGGAAPGQALPTPPQTLPALPQLPPITGQPAAGPVFDGFSPGAGPPQGLPQLGVPQGLTLPQIQPNPAVTQNPSFPIFPRGNPFPNPAQTGPSNLFGAPQNQIPFQGTGANSLPAIDFSGVQQAWTNFRDEFLPRLLERPRVRHTWITGSGDDQLELNELELATTLTRPNFLGSRQPLRISPGFIFHWLDGPDSVLNPGFDLPSQLYSPYLAFDHQTSTQNRSGLETNLTVGFYSDFNNSSSDAIRVTGRLVGWSRINDYTVGKLGVEYFDRIDVKLLPVFGVYMAPNPNIRWELFFPRTKLAHRLPNIGNFEVWSYVGAEYGGGSWALDRADGSSDQADINDVRSYLGYEWQGPKRRTGFLEVGYAFAREIVFRSDPNNELDLEDGFLLRLGLAF